MESEIKFLVDYHAALAQLSSLLGVTFNTKGMANAGLLEKRLMQIMRHHLDGQYSERNLEFTIIWLLVQHLETISEHDPQLLKTFRGNLTSSRADDYFGARFEVNVASTLIKNRLPFTKTESPDFTIHHHDSSAFLECMCVHLTTRKEENTKYKIASAINKKGAKPYCNPATALCIDMTNVSYLSLFTAHPLDTKAIRGYTHDAISHTKFGSVLLFSYIFDMATNRFASAYIRVDNRRIAPTLNGFLDKSFPLGDYRPHPHKIPSWG